MNIAFVSGWWHNSGLIHTTDSIDYTVANLEQMVEDLKNRIEIGSYPTAYKALVMPEKNPHLYDVLVNPYDGSFYWEKSSYTKFDKIKIPTYLLSRWTA